MTFDPASVEVTCVTLPKDHCVQVPWTYMKVYGYSDLFCKKTWTKGHWPLDDLWPHICWGHMCDSTQGSLCPSPMKIHQSMWIQWTFLLKLEPKVISSSWAWFFLYFSLENSILSCVTVSLQHILQHLKKLPFSYMIYLLPNKTLKYAL